MNQVYQIVIPLNINDLFFYNSELVNVHYCPPLFHDQLTANTIQIKERNIDMSAKEIVKSEEEIITFCYDKTEYDNGKVYDPKINKISDGVFGEKKIQKLVFTPPGAKLKLPLK